MLQCVIERPVNRNGLIGVRFFGDTSTVPAAKVAEVLMTGSMMFGKTGPDGVTYLVPTGAATDAEESEDCAALQVRVQTLLCKATVQRSRPNILH